MEDSRFEKDLVRALVAEQHPDLAHLELVDVAGGWDNQQWRLGDELGVRLPRTERAPDLLVNEQRWLPVLAPRLTLPTPVPVRTGKPSPRFGHPWTITRWVHGEPGDRAPITAAGAPEALAAFSLALHQPAPPDAPANAARGIALSTWPGGEDFFDAIDDHPNRGALIDLWRNAVAAPHWSGAPSWLHGDLHPANVITHDGTLTGVIDFGDVCAGDPATDLSAAWLLLPDGGAQEFFAAYARADADTITRARGWAVLRATGLVAIGRAGRLGLPGGKPTWESAGYLALDRLLATS